MAETKSDPHQGHDQMPEMSTDRLVLNIELAFFENSLQLGEEAAALANFEPEFGLILRALD